MEAGVVADEGGTRFDGEDGGESLGKEKKCQGNIEGGAAQGESFGGNGVDEPTAGNNSSQGVDKHHFVEFK